MARASSKLSAFEPRTASMLKRQYLMGYCLNYMSVSVAGMLKLFVIPIESAAIVVRRV
jgi:hypothetical protein